MQCIERILKAKKNKRKCQRLEKKRRSRRSWKCVAGMGKQNSLHIWINDGNEMVGWRFRSPVLSPSMFFFFVLFWFTKRLRSWSRDTIHAHTIIIETNRTRPKTLLLVCSVSQSDAHTMAVAAREQPEASRKKHTEPHTHTQTKMKLYATITILQGPIRDWNESPAEKGYRCRTNSVNLYNGEKNVEKTMYWMWSEENHVNETLDEM